MSASAVALTNGSGYDFTTAQTQAYGSNPMKGFIAGVYGMLSGDCNGNGQVQNSGDINLILRPALGVAGYHGGDANLNGQVQNNDMNLFTRPISVKEPKSHSQLSQRKSKCDQFCKGKTARSAI